MSADHRGRVPEPPRPLRFLVRLLIRGRDASYIVQDLDASFTRDIERGLGRGRAMRRYAWNALASVWSVWTTGLHGLVTHGIGLDAKLGLRMLAKQPLITAVAVLALGIGIPGSLTLLHAIDVVFSDLPIPEADRVVGIRHFDRSVVSPQLSALDDYERWMDLESLESIGAARSYSVNVNAGEADASPVLAARMTASSFDVLRSRPLMGRLIDAADELAGAPDVVLLGEDLWRARFARDPDIVGETVLIGRTPHTVVGVMPSDFRFPLSNEIWLPFRARAVDFASGAGPRAFVFGRLADGITIEDAGVEMTGLTERRASDDPQRFEHVGGEVVAMPLLLLNADSEIWNREVVLFQTLIFTLLMVVCGNVGTLILARTAGRSGEITIRTALGASRARIHAQLFIEALVLAVTAASLGLLAANALVGWLLSAFAPYETIPYWMDFTLTPRIVALALAVAALCAVVAGVLPALSVTRGAIQENLQHASSRGATVRFGLGSSLLIVCQIALSVGFLAMGATRVRTALLYQGVGMGFDPERYVIGTLRVSEPDSADLGSSTDSLAHVHRVAEVQRSLLERLSEDPAVVGLAMGEDVPGLGTSNRTVILETDPVEFDPVDWDTQILRVGVTFFAGLNRPILAGRDFNAGDVEGPPGAPHTAVIVNESFVRHMLGGRNAIGQRFRYQPQGGLWTGGDQHEEEWYEIVGVVGPFGANPRNSARDAAIYHPLAPGEANPVRYTIEVASDAEAFAPRFRQIAASIDREATATSGSLASQIRTASTIFRAISLIVVGVAGATFLLSATGLYALISFTVSQRTREIGIRTALGASTSDIVSAVARRAAIQVGVGLALGVALGWLLLNGDRNDVTIEVANIPVTLAVTAAVAAVVCALACARPTLRGLRIQPTEALRES